jgi:hypothetical protein
VVRERNVEEADGVGAVGCHTLRGVYIPVVAGVYSTLRHIPSQHIKA